jgi:hypothetical protein
LITATHHASDVLVLRALEFRQVIRPGTGRSEEGDVRDGLPGGSMEVWVPITSSARYDLQ